MTALRLDHVVIAVADLDAAMADYRALGFTVVAGGRHAGLTSHNALVAFADGTYLELIAWTAPAPDIRWFREHAACGDGIADFALVPADAAAAVAEAKARGLSLDGPTEGGRLRPDGVEIRWQAAWPATCDLPFLCGDVTPRERRVPGGEACRHANGARGIAGLTVAVRDLEASAQRYGALLGASRMAVVELPAQGLCCAMVKLASATVRLASPAATGSGDPGEGMAVRERLRSRGEGPCSVTLAGDARVRGGPLDLPLCHGARLGLEAAGDGPQRGV